MFVKNAIKQHRREQSGVKRSQIYAEEDKKYANKIRSDPYRKSKLQAVRAANAQKDDVRERKTLQKNTPDYYAVSIVDSAVDTHFKTKFSYLGCVDSDEERTKLRAALHSIIRNHDGICALTGLI